MLECEGHAHAVVGMDQEGDKVDDDQEEGEEGKEEGGRRKKKRKF